MAFCNQQASKIYFLRYSLLDFYQLNIILFEDVQHDKILDSAYT
jgi:hypothetical protein